MNKIYSNFIKRVLDIIIGIVGIIITIPINLIIIIVLWIGQGKPIFFSQIRIGLNGKRFKIYKFRTMKLDAEQLKNEFTIEEKNEYEEKFKLKNDFRITKIGRFLRKTSLDELPQFFNILKGDMTLIGPRPIVEDELEKYENNKSKFLSIKPGLIGYWQAYATPKTTYKERIDMELYYVNNASLKFDIRIFFKSIITVIKKAVQKQTESY